MSIFRPVKIALIGEGQIHGEDDAIAVRPYSATLKCNMADSELLMLPRVEFYRTFRHSQESWNEAVAGARMKEKEYIKRCRCYLRSNKLVDEEAKKAVMARKLKLKNE